MNFVLSHNALNVLELVTKQLRLAIVHQVVPQPATDRHRLDGSSRFQGDPVGVSSCFTRFQPGIGGRRGLQVAPVFTIAHVTPQRLNDRPRG